MSAGDHIRAGQWTVTGLTQVWSARRVAVGGEVVAESAPRIGHNPSRFGVTLRATVSSR